MFGLDRPTVQGIPNGCQHRSSNPAETKALPHEGALAPVELSAITLHNSIEVVFKSSIPGSQPAARYYACKHKQVDSCCWAAT